MVSCQNQPLDGLETRLAVFFCDELMKLVDNCAKALWSSICAHKNEVRVTTIFKLKFTVEVSLVVYFLHK